MEFPAVQGGRYVMLPMVRAVGESPPCNVCPKVPDDAPAKHWSHAADFEPWFWAVRQWFFECRAVGDFERPDPLMRAAAVEFDQAERRAAGRTDNLAAALLASMAKRKR